MHVLRRIAVLTAFTTVSTALVCGVAQAEDDDCVRDTVYQDNRSYSSDEYEFDDLGEYSGSDECPDGPEGSSASDDEDSDAGRFDDDRGREPEDDRGGRGGKAGHNSSDCDASINPTGNGTECRNGPAQRGADGPDRLVF